MSYPSNIIGHKLQIESLLDDLSSDNIVHAYLFSGPQHLGKFTIAKWFAKKLLTQPPVNTGRDFPAENLNIPAENLSDQIDKLLHPDLFVIDQLWIEDVCEDFDVIAQSSNIPQQHRSKAPTAKTDTISIEDIRVLHERLYEIGQGRFRCCLIRSVERMHEEAVNALLKVLEEPPAGVVFLLTTQAIGQIPETLVSRSRVLRFSRVPQKELQPLLEDLSPTDSQFILHVAQGAPGMVKLLRDDPDLLRQEKTIHTQAQSFWQSRQLNERLSFLAPIHERGEEAERFLLHLALTLRELPPAQRKSVLPTLLRLIRGLKTNAQRQLLAQQFALSVS